MTVESPVVPTPGQTPLRGDLPISFATDPQVPVSRDGLLLFDGGWQVVGMEYKEWTGKKGRGQKTSISQKQVGGPGTLIPPRYGTVRVGAIVSSMVVYQGALHMLCIWSEGPIDAVEQLYVGDEAIPTSITATHYLGNAVQAVDPWYAAAWASLGQVYSDTLPNIAYSVVRVPPQTNTGFPEISARIRGLKVALEDGGTPTFSRVPAYIIANHITNTRYGMRSTVDWTSVQTCADYNNEVMADSSLRHVLNVSCDQLSNSEDWLQTLCDYGSIIPIKIGDTWYLIPDAPASSELTLTQAPNVIEKTLRYRKRGPRNSPTVIEVQFTNTTTTPWKDDSAFVYAPGVQEGTKDRILQRVNKPGITSYAQAYRFGLQLLNAYQTSDLTIQFSTTDEALAWTPGTVFTLTAGPFIAKKFRMTKVEPAGPKLYTIYATEYDDAKWSDVVQTGPSSLDTTLPSALTPPTPTDLTVEEDIFQLQTGRFASRLKIAFSGPTRATYVHLRGHTITVTDGTNPFTVELPYNVFTYTTGALPENTHYDISVVSRSEIAESATPAATAITTAGKEAVPGDVQGLTANSVNGETRIFIELGVDLDLTSTELRYSDQTTSAWEDATFLAFVPVPGKSFTTTLIPAGARRIWAKMHDSVATPDFPNGQESVNAVSYDLTVVPNSTSQSDDYPLAALTLTNMIPDGDGGWITAISGDTWDGTFTGVMDTYTDPIPTYHSSGTSSLVTDVVDTGSSEACVAQLDGLDYDDLSGTAQVFIEYKVLVGDSWTAAPDGLTAAVTARYFRATIKWTGTETGHIHALGVLRKVVDSTDRFVKDTILNDEVALVI